MDIITNVLYWLTTGLLVPVIVLLLLLFVRSLLLGGAFYGVYINRQKSKKQLDKAMSGKSVTAFLAELQTPKSSSKFWEFLAKMKEDNQSEAYIDKVIGDYEIVADKDLGQSKSLTKLGPMLGLMGTLIPMGPALVGLSTGDVSTMAHNMQVRLLLWAFLSGRLVLSLCK